MNGRVRNGAVGLVSDRPFCFIGLILGLKDLVFGLALLFQLPELTGSILYLNYAELFSSYAFFVLEIMFIPVSIVLIIAALINRKTLVRYCLTAQATVWLFHAIIYMLNGTFFLAAIFFLAFSAVPGYSSQWMGHWEKVDRIQQDMLD